MTNIEKAKAYDEAIERAKKQRADYQKELDKTDKNSQLAGLLRAGISAIDMAFPELADSEDERIRKEIVNFILYKSGHLLDKETEHRFVSYLEKQKEPSLREFIDDFPYSEQKEQKSAEWSEEDKKMRNKIIGHLYGFIYPNSLYGEDAKECIDWLKSLPERFNLQPKQDWSEEDDALLKEIVAFFRDGKVKLQHDLDLYAGFLENKFKSLRPSWKPSEEQILAIVEALKYLPNNKEEWMILDTLMGVLKKLM